MPGEHGAVAWRIKSIYRFNLFIVQPQLIGLMLKKYAILMGKETIFISDKVRFAPTVAVGHKERVISITRNGQKITTRCIAEEEVLEHQDWLPINLNHIMDTRNRWWQSNANRADACNEDLALPATELPKWAADIFIVATPKSMETQVQPYLQDSDPDYYRKTSRRKVDGNLVKFNQLDQQLISWEKFHFVMVDEWQQISKTNEPGQLLTRCAKAPDPPCVWGISTPSVKRLKILLEIFRRPDLDEEDVQITMNRNHIYDLAMQINEIGTITADGGTKEIERTVSQLTKKLGECLKMITIRRTDKSMWPDEDTTAALKVERKPLLLPTLIMERIQVEDNRSTATRAAVDSIELKFMSELKAKLDSKGVTCVNKDYLLKGRSLAKSTMNYLKVLLCVTLSRLTLSKHANVAITKEELDLCGRGKSESTHIRDVVDDLKEECPVYTWGKNRLENVGTDPVYKASDGSHPNRKVVIFCNQPATSRQWHGWHLFNDPANRQRSYD